MSHEVASPAPAALWHALLATSPAAMAFQSPQWTSAVCAAGGGWRDASRLYTTAEGSHLVLPLLARGLAGAVEYASLPYGWGFGGPVSGTAVSPADVALVTADVASLPGLRLSLRPDPLLGPLWERALPHRGLTVPRSAHVLDLSGGFGQVWSGRFTGSARTAVRKAERAGLEVEVDASGRLLPVFHQLYEQSVRRWNAGRLGRWRARRRDPASKFRAVVEHAGALTRVWVARHRGEPAAALVTVSLGRTTNYWRGAMDESLAGPTRANYLLQRLAIEQACDAGCTTYHMGETGGSVSLSQFKSRFGARAVAYRELRVERLPVTRARAAVDLAQDRARALVPARRQGAP